MGHSGGGDAVDEIGEDDIRVLLVHADPAFYRDLGPPGGGVDHRGAGSGDEVRLPHQAGAEGAGLHTVGGAADIQIDLAITEIERGPHRLRQQFRLRAAELQGDGLFLHRKPQQAVAVAMNHRRRRHHLGIEQRVAAEEAVEIAAMPVRPVHHRRDGQAAPGLDPGADISIGVHCAACSAARGRRPEPPPPSGGEYGAQRAARGQASGRARDRGGVDAEMPVEIANRTGLAEMFDAERDDRVPLHTAKP